MVDQNQTCSLSIILIISVIDRYCHYTEFEFGSFGIQIQHLLVNQSSLRVNTLVRANRIAILLTYTIYIQNAIKIRASEIFSFQKNLRRNSYLLPTLESYYLIFFETIQMIHQLSTNIVKNITLSFYIYNIHRLINSTCSTVNQALT